jgi:hypothetical protein
VITPVLGVIRSVTPRPFELIAKALGMTDYRQASGSVRIHPILAADHRPGFLAMLPSGSVTPPRLMAAFETILGHLESLAR